LLHRHGESRKHQVRFHMAGHGPAHYSAAENIQNHREEKETFPRRDIGDCQTAPKIDPQSASNFDPLELSVMASPRGRGGGSLLASVFEPPTVVAGLDDLAMMGDSVQERRGHLGVAKDLAPLAKGQVGRHQDRSPFVEL